MIISIFVAIFIVSTSLAEAAEFNGLAAFASMSSRFPCEQYLKTMENSERPAMVVLWRSFGEDLTCVNKFLSRYADRPHLLQIHLSNEVCRRNKRCFEGELFRELNVRLYNIHLELFSEVVRIGIQDRVREIRAFVESSKNQNTTVVLSAGLEDNYTVPAFNNLLKYLRQEWPYMISRNPLKPEQGRLGADFLEVHLLNYNFRGEPCIATEDGVGGTFRQSAQFLANFNQCFAAILWRKDSQGAGQRRWQQPRKRKFSISSRQFHELRTLLRWADQIR